MAFSSTLPVSHTPVTRLARTDEGGWELWRGDSPYFVQGAGGADRLDLLAAAGANTFRTWHTRTPERLDQAQRRGLTVMAGLSVAHERHGFDYNDTARVEDQRAVILETVRRLKDHPALLLWGLGNETEGFERPEGNPLVWRELDTLARLIKAEDPNHPVCTVIAGPGEAKLASFERLCPNIDILGVNAYGEAPLVPQALLSAGITRPFLITEFGPTGHWESPTTAWGAPIEPLPQEKAASYLASYREVLRRGRGRCLGTFAFLWGHKQEVTPTWYGMFLPGGERTAAIDAMTLAWSGRLPELPCPEIAGFESALVEAVVSPGSLFEVGAKVHATAGGPIEVEWQVMAESDDRKVGGDPERVPPEFPDCVVSTGDDRATIRTPSRPGPYRLFLRVRDSHGGGAAANFPFFVSETGSAGSL